MYQSFSLANAINQPVLFKSEAEVWDQVAAVNKSGKGISPDVHWAYRGLIDNFVQLRTDSNYHPLDYPIIRYFLLGDLHAVHLPYVFHPNFLSKVRGNDRVRQFFHELSAENPANHYNRTASLRAVWNCAKYVTQIGGKVTDFHVQSSDDSSSQGSCDVLFSFENESWHCEVKHLLHPDITLYCIANALAGMLYLEEQGRSLRKYRCITLKGDNINYEFRNEVIEFIHDPMNGALAKFDEETPKKPRICCHGHSFIITSYPTRKRILLQSDSEPKRQVKFLFREDQQSDPPYDCYEVGPSHASSWPAPLSQQFLNKLDKKIEVVEDQLKKGPVHSIGFLYLDLPEAHIDARKPPTESQDWEQTLEDCLNRSNLPLILMTESTRLQRDIHVINHAAKRSSFIRPDGTRGNEK
ncbi:MAG: hypothetical protein ISS70_08750 [Phycisphaerae bacterium]|nr:hypothetical protein [Phycisphaerae bacterium]